MIGRPSDLARRLALRLLVPALLLGPATFLLAQEPTTPNQATEVPLGPKPLEDFEVDTDEDGVPDGWYNLRDAKVVEGGVGGPKTKCFRFENARPGRPSRASRAFGVDGREFEAVVIGIWVRQESVVSGDRLGDEPALMVDFLSDPLQLRTVRRGGLGPWKSIGPTWTRVVKRISIPPDTRLAILSIGLLGATGAAEFDNMTVDLVPIGGKATSNLAANGDFELGDPAPTGWQVDHGARRVFPGNRSHAAIELKGNGARAFTGLAVPIQGLGSLDISLAYKGTGLRGASGAMAAFYFLDDDGRPLPGLERGVPALSFASTPGWQPARATVPIPPNAIRALIQFEKESAYGTLLIDDVRVEANGGATQWTPDHVETGTTGWFPVAPSPSIVEKSALDASALLDAPAGKHGFVTVKGGRLAFSKGKRARFFGVSLLPPTAFPADRERAVALADRLARSGVNLVRLGDLDVPLGPSRSLFDDTRDDTKELDPEALSKLDWLIAALKERGIYVAIELQSGRKFREGDDSIANARHLPPGGGPAAAFDPAIREAARKGAEALLSHVNPGTGLALRADPVLAWVTLAGELTLFDLVDPDRFSGTEVAAIRDLMRKDEVATARRGWQAAEGEQWRTLADQLRKAGLKVPIAGGSHWRRDYDYSAAEAVSGLDLIDDRLYYNPPSWAGPDRRSILWSRTGGLLSDSSKKRKADRPYVVGQWAVPTFGAWASPYEGADLLLAVETAARDDWDALIRRGVFMFPRVWGADAAGTGGGEDIFSLTEVVNGIPQAFALLPHASSILLNAPETSPHPGASRKSARTAHRGVGGWDSREGRLVIDTPHTRAVAGWVGESGATFDGLTIDVSAGPFGVVAVSSFGAEPIATGKRLLVTAIARVEPTGFRWADEWKREPADPGIPPLLKEPLKANVSWKKQGNVKGYALDNTGARVAPVTLEKIEGGYRLAIDGRSPGIHWEMAVE